MMTLIEAKHALVKNDLLRVGFGSTGTRTVNTPPNIQVRGFTSLGEAPPPTIVTGQDNA
jgi:hypothetical protein